jgi:hypothetical protein
VPLETRARVCAERLLIVTEALADAVLKERYDEVTGLLASRQSMLDEIATMALDSPSLAILERVRESEEDLFAMLGRTQGALSGELTALHSGTRLVRAYRPTGPRAGLQRTG